MKLIIDIPEREYKVICENNYVAVCACPNLLSNAIKNGTVLPKHGRLIDADALIKEYGKYDIGVFVNKADTILESDMVEPQEVRSRQNETDN